MFQEIAHVPFWIYDPRHPHLGGVRRDALATTIDIAPTVLGFFGVPLPVDMQGKPLEGRMVSAEACVRDGTIYGKRIAGLSSCWPMLPALTRQCPPPLSLLGRCIRWTSERY